MNPRHRHVEAHEIQIRVVAGKQVQGAAGLIEPGPESRCGDKQQKQQQDIFSLRSAESGEGIEVEEVQASDRRQKISKVFSEDAGLDLDDTRAEQQHHHSRQQTHQQRPAVEPTAAFFRHGVRLQTRVA